MLSLVWNVLLWLQRTQFAARLVDDPRDNAVYCFADASLALKA